MRVVVIPDIHLKPWLFDRAEEILASGKAQRAVCLMDIPDDWGMEIHIERYEETFDRAIAFAKAHPDTLWCYGNHDISYVWGKLETGYSAYAEATVREKLRRLQETLPKPENLNFIHRIDKVLFLHGGLTTSFVRSINKGLVDAYIDAVISAVNDLDPEILWKNDSPLWYRPQVRNKDIFRADTFVQVVGHTPVDAIYEEKSVISTDVFSTYRDGTQIGESAMLVIDTKTGRYDKVSV
ncbi:MAG: metallophosphoesterase [Lachnospiraceae bacterium]|nr:metallophosphoesterase [Lachnospiraceae bacterium]